jgi:hypothetical protein
MYVELPAFTWLNTTNGCSRVLPDGKTTCPRTWCVGDSRSTRSSFFHGTGGDVHRLRCFLLKHVRIKRLDVILRQGFGTCLVSERPHCSLRINKIRALGHVAKSVVAVVIGLDRAHSEPLVGHLSYLNALHQGDVSFRHASAALVLQYTLKNSPAFNLKYRANLLLPSRKGRVLPRCQ